jgi:putative colanic acid biosynthesis acetyltransferase WcaB
MKLIEKIRIDVKVNKGNNKGKFIVLSYRITNHITERGNIFVKIIGYPIVKLYHWLFVWFMGIEIPTKTKIGYGLQVWHGVGLIINPGVIIGNNVLLRQTTTIGNKYLGSGCPRIGNDVEIGAHCVIIGNIEIGDNTTIGAGTIVTKSIPSDSIAYGNPMTIKLKKETKTIRV